MEEISAVSKHFFAHLPAHRNNWVLERIMGLHGLLRETVFSLSLHGFGISNSVPSELKQTK